MPTVQQELPQQFGRYRIIRLIAQGGMGAVYLAQDSILDRRVAVKVPHFSEDVNPVVLERFLNEARLAAKVQHPHLCSIFDAGEIDGIHYITMPFIEGPTLASLISENQPWAPERALRLTYRLALALQALHDQGIVHRDLKPGNVMLQNGAEPVVMDFGIARHYDSQTHHLTGEGMTLGTPVYMPPEQLLGNHKDVGPRSDVYSLGVILYQMLAGRLPFDGNIEAVYAQILHTDATPPSTFSPEISPRIDELCLKAIAKSKDDRFYSMSAFSQAIAQLLGGAGDPTNPIFPQFPTDVANVPTEPQMMTATPPELSEEPALMPPAQTVEGVSTATRVLNVILPLLPWIVTAGFVLAWTMQNR